MRVLMPVTLVLYAIVALVWLHRWPSAVAALIVGALLWRRHPRARFSAYILFSAMAARAAFAGGAESRVRTLIEWRGHEVPLPRL